MDDKHTEDSRPDSILIVDFGSQVTQLIARRVREAGVYSEIAPFSLAEEAFQRMKPKGIILSGSPASVPDEGSPRCPQSFFEAGIPILGICYGQQVMSQQLGGQVRPGHETGEGGEFGRAPPYRQRYQPRGQRCGQYHSVPPDPEFVASIDQRE